MRLARLTCAVQQGGAREPLSIVAFDGNEWSAPRVVAGSSLTSPPALVRFGEALYCLHQDPEEQGGLVALAFDGARWSDEAPVAGRAMSGAPGAAVLGGRLYAVHQGYAASHRLSFESTEDGRSWTTPAPWGARTQVDLSAAAATFGGRLYVVYSQPSIVAGGSVAYVTYDGGTSWAPEAPVPGASGLNSGAGAAVFEERLYVTFRDSNRALRCASFDGDHWQGAQAVPGTSGQLAGGTCAVAFEELLYVLYRSAAGLLAYMTFDGSAWHGPASAGSFRIANDPAAAVF